MNPRVPTLVTLALLPPVSTIGQETAIATRAETVPHVWTLGSWSGIRRDGSDGSEGPIQVRVRSILGGAGVSEELEVTHGGDRPAHSAGDQNEPKDFQECRDTVILHAGTPLGAGVPSATGPDEIRDASRELEGLVGTFVALSGDRTIRHDPRRAGTRFSPASTFKIPHALIALETGVATGAEFRLPWSGRVPEGEYWRASWSRDHTLRTAMRDSVVWYFRETARRIGSERMQTWVDRFGYGNRDISGEVDRFWLDGPLRISADEQVVFLRALHEGRLGVSERASSVVRDILVLERSPDYVLSGKTGTTRREPSGTILAWLVGYVEREGRAHFFAMNLDCPSFEECEPDRGRRIAIAVLSGWGVLPPAGE
jgi:beta-lactamase class D